jgi:hypothetical protein
MHNLPSLCVPRSRPAAVALGRFRALPLSLSARFTVTEA